MQKKTKQEYLDEVINQAEANALVIDKKKLKKPSASFYRDLGKQVAKLLTKKENLMPDAGIVSDAEIFRKEAVSHPVLYVKVSTYA